jgi:hypothetical protein
VPARNNPIPDPEYITETVNGTLYPLAAPHGGGLLLVIGVPDPNWLAAHALPAPADPDSGAPPPITATYSGPITLRYGIPHLIPPGETLIPGLLAGERGGFMTGREAWDYMQARFQMFPRADVVGIKPDGRAVQVFLRELDLGAPVQVYAYPDPATLTPLGRVNGVWRAADAPDLPEFLALYGRLLG